MLPISLDRTCVFGRFVVITTSIVNEECCKIKQFERIRGALYCGQKLKKNTAGIKSHSLETTSEIGTGEHVEETTKTLLVEGRKTGHRRKTKGKRNLRDIRKKRVL